MGLRFTVLASGSTGNATIVQGSEKTVLVDAGLSMKKLEEVMREQGIAGHHLDALFVTHEHSDHIKGLGAFARKYELPIYANEATWGALERHVGNIAPEKRVYIETGETVDFGPMKVQSYPISHDAAEPVGYTFEEHGEKLSLATDLGYMSEKVKRHIIDSDVLVLESNHDTEMLRMGRYPWNIKRRILSDIGHLSNVAAGEALCELMTDRTKRVYLAHLSLDHNVMDLAKLTVNTILEDHGIFYKKEEHPLRETHHDRPTPWDEVRRK
ncbi:MBL fold metallo-hydrolase [Paenibacillus harenae]|uniref:Phosphoribosyl 1,2-cyclic phosphodiesterase n=1 Tax=Paenibacillus harenae TaxID=306543 RepID=A0ABT9U0P3_PAEHA|nr:MBL fold metallo-hydrolase [Paenibacillus harenae]MDQ0061568.1 phosphoribosyl 1,2-cyclic phosphodiesterase [Paenibacillus harenae]MDQ0113205.1 phosphoribosyl 1,2-cyclic phosphodiesterase [Paenibacillus harenae]